MANQNSFQLTCIQDAITALSVIGYRDISVIDSLLQQHIFCIPFWTATDKTQHRISYQELA